MLLIILTLKKYIKIINSLKPNHHTIRLIVAYVQYNTPSYVQSKPNICEDLHFIIILHSSLT
jgi:hypothetical protein